MVFEDIDIILNEKKILNKTANYKKIYISLLIPYIKFTL